VALAIFYGGAHRPATTPGPNDVILSLPFSSSRQAWRLHAAGAQDCKTGKNSKPLPKLSQTSALACSNNVDTANEGVIEVGVSGARLDLETLFHAQYGRIARVIAGTIKDPARAEELAVEVFLKWQRTPQAHGEGAEGWLYRSAIRIALNELRRKALRTRYESLLEFMWCGKKTGRTPDELFAAQEQEGRVRLVLGGLDPGQAELLLLRANDFSYQELAAMLNLNPASIGTLLSRALKAFRREFIARYGEERYGYK
jgi:RNA polymerase sigma-70 factor, ECF subfamily